MNKKWFLLLASIMLSAVMVAGCGANDDPSPPVDENQEEAPFENDPLHDAEDSRDDIGENNDAEENMEGIEENVEEPFEDPDNDGNDEMDPNPAED
ncbi:hypothetical protein [Mesobacillus maritimus]|uniref:hypothetical protein n=1 Tax=Mesobacillus maritimus TaxID=1643336 RepID=UPI00384E4984